MSAGDSAEAEGRRQLALADAHTLAASRARHAASRYDLAASTERRTVTALAALAAAGHHLLPDRGWPGSRTAQVDLVVVGPGGVFIVDTKAWADVTIDRERVYRGQADVTDDLMALADLAYTAEAGFAEVGLAPGEVRPVVVLAGRRGVDERVGPLRVVGERDVLRHIASFGRRLTQAQIDVVLARALTLFPQVGPPSPVNVAVAEPVLSPRAAVEPDALLTRDEVDAAQLEAILAAPIEDWMTFLRPAQAKLVRRSFNGPARIRGAAGTGKTVVGLHRAAYLARSRPGTVLVTTFVRTLPQVLRQLLARLAPDVVDKIEFASVHGFARRLLSERGVRVQLEPVQAANAMERAWNDVGRDGPLAGTGLDRSYWEDEITHVLKGRGITRFDDYANLARTGRRHRLPLELRTAVWELYLAYDRDLRAHGCHDYADLILLAEAELRREPLAVPYSAVIVDEAQDLSCAMIRLLHGLVGDAHDGLTLIGDGQQAIYPGGYTLAEAGVSLAGRGVVLDVNYRNTAQIMAFAAKLVAGDEFADIEGVPSYGDVPGRIARNGPKPHVEHCVSWRAREVLLVERVRSVIENVGTGLGDVGVLCATTTGVSRAVAALGRAGIAVQPLADYDGARGAAVKVGTIKRAKGLEFKQVLLADVQENWVADGVVPAEGAERERWELRRRELYVAMTRARDGLWVGIV
ncbi:nuclease-related domain-containing DEAD/DEAH box helicase [Pengzhenrongella sicca]|uniref:DNA 3'-5' helicase n=1 Tax=Pengzhenrongella sicca TaxID=2819238 RepID=A0A8A4ZF77_9MICO|nr:UvrD-helicase domain-containing protein [Pengzhenrongella sicca]QTE29563.1 UvrD-helicase domain-containing protein [Pengzhenrongella sicca]